MSKHRWMSCALLVLLGSGGGVARACSTAAWSTGSGIPMAVEPFDQPGATRYSGSCALAGVPGTASYVSTNIPSDSTFRARFYVYTGTADASPTVFRATTADNLGGANVVSVVYDASLQRFRFVAQGETLLAAPGSAPHDRWIAVELFYQAGAPLQAWTTHRGVETPLSGSVNAPMATIESSGLGVVVASAGAGSMYFDAFEATRSAASRIGPLCRGETSFDGSIGFDDVAPIATERVERALANGQPDCNEDGQVDVFDVACVHRRRISANNCSVLGKGGRKGFDLILADGFE